MPLRRKGFPLPKLVTILLMTMLSPYLQAQDAKHNSLTLNWGMGYLMRQDITVSPFIHKDISPISGLLTYSRSQLMDHQLDIAFSFFNPRIADPYPFNSYFNGQLPGWPHSFRLVDLNYALGKSVINQSKWRLVTGGKSRNHIYSSDYNFGPSGPSPMFISFGLDLWVNTTYNISEKHQLRSNLSLPIFSYIYREPYLAQDDEFFLNIYSHIGLKQFAARIKDGKLRSWGSSQLVDLDFRYAYILNENWDLGLSYLFSMNLNQIPTHYAQFTNSLLVGGKFKF